MLCSNYGYPDPSPPGRAMVVQSQIHDAVRSIGVIRLASILDTRNWNGGWPCARLISTASAPVLCHALLCSALLCFALLCCAWTVPIRRPPSEARKEGGTGGLCLCLCLLVPIAQISLVCSLSLPQPSLFRGPATSFPRPRQVLPSQVIPEPCCIPLYAFIKTRCSSHRFVRHLLCVCVCLWALGV